MQFYTYNTSCFSKYIVLIQMVTLACILFTVAYRMMDFEAFKEILKAPVSDSIVLITTFALRIFVDLVYAIEIGMILASLLFSDIANIETSSHDVYECTEEDKIEKKRKIKGIKKLWLYRNFRKSKFCIKYRYWILEKLKNIIHSI